MISWVIPNPVFSSSNIFSDRPPNKKEELAIPIGDIILKIKQVKVCSVGENKNLFLGFLNVALRNLMHKHSYTELGKSRKFFNTTKYDKPEPSIRLFSGYQANFLVGESKFFLRVDPAKKIVRTETALLEINRIYAENKTKEREEKRNLVKEGLVGKTLMTNYGKARYFRVDDVCFDNPETKFIPGTTTSLKDYYYLRYNVKI